MFYTIKEKKKIDEAFAEIENHVDRIKDDTLEILSAIQQRSKDNEKSIDTWAKNYMSEFEEVGNMMGEFKKRLESVLKEKDEIIDKHNKYANKLEQLISAMLHSNDLAGIKHKLKNL